MPADLASFTGRNGRRIVEPGDLVLSAGRSSADLPFAHTVRLVGPEREVDHTRRLHPDVVVEVTDAAASAVTPPPDAATEEASTT